MKILPRAARQSAFRSLSGLARDELPGACLQLGACCLGDPMFRPCALVGLFSKLRSNFNSMIPPHWIEIVHVFRFERRAQIGPNKRSVNDET